jgi:hypothetical protein
MPQVLVWPLFVVSIVQDCSRDAYFDAYFDAQSLGIECNTIPVHDNERVTIAR